MARGGKRKEGNSVDPTIERLIITHPRICSPVLPLEAVLDACTHKYIARLVILGKPLITREVSKRCSIRNVAFQPDHKIKSILGIEQNSASIVRF